MNIRLTGNGTSIYDKKKQDIYIDNYFWINHKLEKKFLDKSK